MTRIVGIDLGTTNSAVAAMQADGKPGLLTNREGWTLTPSVVFFDGDDALVGSTATRAAAMSPDDYVQFVKRQMGDPHWRFVDTQDHEYRPEEISALILKRLRDDAALALGEPVTDAVITVPAYFDDARRKATRDAGEIAGLTVQRLINEPTAAAIAFGMDRLATGNIFVYDLGGGTFDVTVLKAGPNQFDVLGTEGDRNLGGYDFDNVLMLHVAQRIQADGGPDPVEDPRLEFQLREQCEQAKRRLTTTSQATIFVSAGGKNFKIQVTRDEFEAMTRELLERTEILASGVLDDAGLSWTDIEHLLLVGGSTRMPMVKAMMERISGKTAAPGVNPDEAVALGAAIVAGTMSKADDGQRTGIAIRLSDVTSKSMGIVALDRSDNYKRYNSIILPHNTRIPAKDEQVYYTVEHHQRRLDVEVTEGNEPELEYTSILKVQSVPLPTGLPKESPLKVIMEYDIDQLIHVEVIDLTGGKSLDKFELKHESQLTAAEVDRMRSTLDARELQ